MNLKEVKVYQSVLFETKQITFFTVRNSAQAHLKMEAGPIGVRISSDIDTVIVPYTNVAYMKPDESKVEAIVEVVSKQEEKSLTGGEPSKKSKAS